MTICDMCGRPPENGKLTEAPPVIENASTAPFHLCDPCLASWYGMIERKKERGPVVSEKRRK